MSDFREHARNHLRTAASINIWVDSFNKERLLEPLGYITPIEAEEKYEQALKSDKITA